MNRQSCLLPAFWRVSWNFLYYTTTLGVFLLITRFFSVLDFSLREYWGPKVKEMPWLECVLFIWQRRFSLRGATTGTKEEEGLYSLTIFTSVLCKSKKHTKNSRYPNKTVLSIKIFVLLNWKKLPIFLYHCHNQPSISSSNPTAPV